MQRLGEINFLKYCLNYLNNVIYFFKYVHSFFVEAEIIARTLHDRKIIKVQSNPTLQYAKNHYKFTENGDHTNKVMLQLGLDNVAEKYQTGLGNQF